MTRIESFIWKSSFIVFVFTVKPALPYGKGGSEGNEFADPVVTVRAGEVAPRVRGEEEGDVLERCARGAG